MDRPLLSLPRLHRPLLPYGWAFPSPRARPNLSSLQPRSLLLGAGRAGSRPSLLRQGAGVGRRARSVPLPPAVPATWRACSLRRCAPTLACHRVSRTCRAHGRAQRHGPRAQRCWGTEAPARVSARRVGHDRALVRPGQDAAAGQLRTGRPHHTCRGARPPRSRPVRWWAGSGSPSASDSCPRVADEEGSSSCRWACTSARPPSCSRAQTRRARHSARPPRPPPPGSPQCSDRGAAGGEPRCCAMACFGQLSVTSARTSHALAAPRWSRQVSGL